MRHYVLDREPWHYEQQKKKISLLCVNLHWNLSVFVFSFQILLLLTQVSRRLVFVCVSTFPEPCPSNQHTAREGHGKISDEYEPQSTHQLEDNQGLRGQKGKDKKGETFFFSRPSKKTV